MKTTVKIAEPKEYVPFPCVRSDTEGTVVMFTSHSRAVVLQSEGVYRPGEVLDGRDGVAPYDDPCWTPCSITLSSLED